MSRQTRHGFTLIEMLMVILIIGLLVSLVIPGLNAPGRPWTARPA